jgi:DNA-binding MarR family transcriptional regulator
MADTDRFNRVLQDWSEVFMRRSMRDFKRFMDDSGLSPSQIATLMRLHHRGHCGVSDIGEHVGVTNAAASQMVDRMVQLGLCTRQEGRRDRRFKQIALAPQGEALVRAGIEARRAWLEGLTTTLAPQEQEAIIAALVLLTEAARSIETNETL